jgi:hypothetical protein
VSATAERAVIALLTAQALAFGVMLALVVIPANALFLDAYGAKWLPATYIAIAVLGTAGSAFIARAARRTRLVRVATVTLSILAALYAASWVILVSGGVWVSALLLVLFPIALQLGFVFIGGQAGRLLDVRQMKERFPRIVGGFSVGFLLGGLAGIPLLDLLGSTENLLLGGTAAQLAFVGLLLATERRFPEVRSAPAEGSRQAARPSARALFGSSLVVLLLVYQVLSAMGSWLVDYLLFNRANEHYSGDELTRFLSGYTALINLADILFLALLAGPLMRRFGLRLGLVLNPAVVVALLGVTAVLVAGPGAAAFSVFVVVAGARLLDIVLSDGTTRTSVNASFQMVPIGDRLAVQAVVEGIGVPVAIGATGAVLLLMNLLGLGIGAVVALTVVLSVVWTVSGAAMYRSYTRALADEMKRRSLEPAAFDVAEDDAALQALLESDDARDVRLGLDLLPGGSSPAAAGALRQACAHADPEVRARALVQLAAAGDDEAAAAAGALAVDLSRSSDPACRRAAAAALGARAAGDRSTLVLLLDDGDRTVRVAALDAVTAGDAGEPEVGRRVVAAVGEPRTAGPAAAALRRLGDSGIALLAAALETHAGPARAPLIRAAAAAAATHGVAALEPALRDRDRAVVLTALDAVDAAEGAAVMPPDILDAVFEDAAAHAGRALAARIRIADDSSLRRALDDESDLARRLVIAVLALRYGRAVRDAVRVVESSTDGQRRALGVEALDVIISREEAAIALPLVRRDLTPDEQAAAVRCVEPSELGREEWIADMADDPRGVWRSSWLALCARHAAAR